MRMRVQSLALLSGLRIHCCREVYITDVAWIWSGSGCGAGQQLQTASTEPLAWELPYTTLEAIKRKKKKENKFTFVHISKRTCWSNRNWEIIPPKNIRGIELKEGWTWFVDWHLLIKLITKTQFYYK